MEPSVGRIVHYYRNGELRPAIITSVPATVDDKKRVWLTYFDMMGGVDIDNGVPHGKPDEGERDEVYWVWPPKV